MMRLYFGDLPDVLYSGNKYFDRVVDESCLETDFSKKVIKEIDNGVVYDRNLIISDVLGGIPPERLAGGTKSLLILMYTDQKMALSAMGDNCLPFLFDIGEIKDFTVCTKNLRPLFDNSNLKEVYIINVGIIVHNQKELYDSWVRCVIDGRKV